MTPTVEDRQLEEVLRLLDEMTAHGLVPDVQTYRLVLTDRARAVPGVAVRRAEAVLVTWLCQDNPFLLGLPTRRRLRVLLLVRRAIFSCCYQGYETRRGASKRLAASRLLPGARLTTRSTRRRRRVENRSIKRLS